jgi:hypothetical protein
MRTIRYSAAWDQCVANMGETVERLDALLEGVEWAISKDAEAFDSVPDTALRIVLTDAFPGVPAFVIYIRIEDDSYCCMDWIERDPTVGQDDGEEDA